MKVNRKHKDRLFKFIFQEKENLLQLYNALNGTEYNEPEDLEIVTLEDVIYMRMKNDIAFVLDYCMNLFEHQSTDNPNMPLRGLLYFARQYEKYVNEKGLNLYGKKQLQIPTPQYVVFYNGTEWTGERKILKLSDSFAGRDVKPCMELEVLQLNINYGHNKEIMEKCRILWEYAVFIRKVRTYNEDMNIEKAIDRAVTECIEEGILKEILISHQAEVKNMLLTEYDEETTRKMYRLECEEEIAQIRKMTEEKVAKAEEKVAKAEEKVAEAEEKVAEAEEKAVKAEEKVAEAEEKVAKAEEIAKQMQRELEELRKKIK